MTNKTVTMSRELAERIFNLGWFGDGADDAEEELRAILAKNGEEPLGVEPTLRDHCKQCAEVVKTWPESKRDCLGKVEPVVERQPVAVLGYSVVGNRYAIAATKGEILELHEGYADHMIELVDIKHVTRLQPELAELQSTIARLETQIANAINLDFERRAKIERLKGG